MARKYQGDDHNDPSSYTENSLRRRAEKLAEENAAQSFAPSSDIPQEISLEAMREALHELQVYQIELEMQN